MINDPVFWKWYLYEKAYGRNTTEWHETWFYTEEQEHFFQQYEQQLVTDTYLAGLLAEICHEEV